MKNLCRFEDCRARNNMNAVYVDTISGTFELEWCKKCGRIQNQIK